MQTRLNKHEYDNLAFKYHYLTDDLGYLIDKIPQNISDQIKVNVDNIQSNFDPHIKVNDTLVGEIEHEYHIDPSNELKQYLKGLCERLEYGCKYYSNNFDVNEKLAFSPMWVNFQKKHEYNPIHSHHGIYSFVIWHKIPYNISDEQKLTFRTDHSTSSNGQFHFVYPIKGDKATPFPIDSVYLEMLDIDKTKEGYIAVFPSILHHVVYPFYTSDEYRITISGNIGTGNMLTGEYNVER